MAVLARVRLHHSALGTNWQLEQSGHRDQAASARCKRNSRRPDAAYCRPALPAHANAACAHASSIPHPRPAALRLIAWLRGIRPGGHRRAIALARRGRFRFRVGVCLPRTWIARGASDTPYRRQTGPARRPGSAWMRVAASHCAACAEVSPRASPHQHHCFSAPQRRESTGFSAEKRRPPRSNDPIILNIRISTEGEINVAVKWDV